MKPPTHKYFLVAFFAAIAAVSPPPLQGATVTLTNGDVLEGEIVQRNSSGIQIKSIGATLTIPAPRIRSIEEGGPGSVQLHQAAGAIAVGDIDKARQFLEEARKAGAPEADLAESEKAIERRRAEDELKQYTALINEARAAIKQGQDSPALAQLRTLLSKMPEDNPARPEIAGIVCDFHLAIAASYRDRMDSKRAVDELRKAIALDPKRAQPYIDMADLYKTSSGTWDQAIINYLKAQEVLGEGITPALNARIHWELGEIFRQRVLWRDASINYRLAHLDDPAVNPRLVERLQEAFWHFGTELQATEPDVALLVVEEGLSVRMNADLLQLKGTVLAKLKRNDDAIAALTQLAALEPKRRDTHFQIAQCHFGLGQLLQGREMLLREVEVNPRNYDALCQLGDFAIQRDDYEAAADFYTRAQALDRDKPRASLGLGKTYRAQKKLAEARIAVDEVLSRLPEDREANLEMGRIYRDEDNLEEAREFFTEVLRLIENAPSADQAGLVRLGADALIARGEIALLTAGPGTANIDFRKAIDVLPDYGQAFFSIGRAYRKKYAASKAVEDLKEAETNLQKARTLEPENAQFALELGILYAEELAQVDKANEKEYNQKAVENWNAYIELGGANAPQVKAWLAEMAPSGG